MFVEVPAISNGGGLLPCMHERQLLILDQRGECMHENGHICNQNADAANSMLRRLCLL